MLLYRHIVLKNLIMFKKNGELSTYKGYPGKEFHLLWDLGDKLWSATQTLVLFTCKIPKSIYSVLQGMNWCLNTSGNLLLTTLSNKCTYS